MITDTAYFQLFDLPVAYAVDLSLLAARYRERQQAMHPDRYASASPGERLRAVQLSSRLNEAYHCLRHPLLRAVYLLSLKGVDAGADVTFRKDTAFLQQQMVWREALAELAGTVDPLQGLDRLLHDCSEETARVEAAFQRAWEHDNLEEAAACVARWQFLDKFRAELEATEERMLDR